MPIFDKLTRLAQNATTQYGEMTRVVNNTAVSGTATLQVHIDDPKNMYTSGDIITGEVTLVLKKEVDISELTVKYKVDETTELHQAEDFKDKRQDQVTFKGAARVYENSVRLFPSEQDLGQLRMQKLTLSPGTHKYPFSARIPGHAKDNYKVLPPSFVDPEKRGTICHTLKVTLVRSSSFKQNSRFEVPLQYLPACSSRELGQMHTLGSQDTAAEHGSVLNRKQTTLRASVTLPAAFQPHSTLPIQAFNLESLQGSPFTVLDVVGELFGTSSIIAQQRQEEHHVRYVLFQRSINSQASKINLANQIGHVETPAQLVPSFETKFISMKYTLQFTVRVAVGSNNKVSTLQFGGEIRVLGPHLFQETETYHQQEEEEPPAVNKLSTLPNENNPFTKHQPKSGEETVGHTFNPSSSSHAQTTSEYELSSTYPSEKHDPDDLPPAYGT